VLLAAASRVSLVARPAAAVKCIETEVSGKIEFDSIRFYGKDEIQEV
jgi:hypothetical protein